MDPLILLDPEAAMAESMEKIFELLEEKKYFMARDELLKYNDADIAEMFEELLIGNYKLLEQAETNQNYLLEQSRQLTLFDFQYDY